MATTYKSTIDVRCVKEHTCLCCGGTYAYELRRKVTGSARSKESAESKARANAARVVERDVDMEPCPTCGVHQPDMIGQRRAKRHSVVFWVSAVAFVALVIVRACYGLHYDMAVWLAVAACVAAAVAHLIVDLADPNRDLDANRQNATQRVAAGMVRHAPGQFLAGSEQMAMPSRSLVQHLSLLLLLIAVVLAAAPEEMRLARGWPLNAECYPPAIGLGDETRIYMTEKIQSIKGFWHGEPQVAFHEPGGQPIAANATTNQNDWGQTISAKSSEKRDSSTPWVSVTVPNNAALAGKTVNCEIHLNVTYPEIKGDNTFEVVSSNMQRNLDVQLAATAGAGSIYNSCWWYGTVSAMGLILLSGRFLIWAAWGLERKAKPTKVYAPQ